MLVKKLSASEIDNERESCQLLDRRILIVTEKIHVDSGLDNDGAIVNVATFFPTWTCILLVLPVLTHPPSIHNR